jgi:serine/threonine-protein kinase
MQALEKKDPLLVALRGCVLPERTVDEAGCRRLEARAKALAGVWTDTADTIRDRPDVAKILADPARRFPIRFGKYELLQQLGKGGMGVVYKARQIDLDRVVALKMIQEGAYAAPEDLERFRVEAKAVTRLTHPNVISVYDFDQHAGQLYYTMEYVTGGSLADRLAGWPPFTARQAAALVQKLARAVHAAHQKQIVHRDLKPGNVLFRADGTPQIVDFGLAKMLDAASDPSQCDDPVGTASYMAPEQVLGKTEAIGPAADVYGLGAILYEVLCGRPPFQGADRNATLNQVCCQAPQYPSALRRRVPRALEAICLKCLEKTPSQRYASAEALADELGRWRRGAGRKPVILGGIVCAMLMALLTLSFAARFDPERPRKQVKALLRDGQPYEYKVREGDPGPFRWVFPTPDKLSVDPEAGTLTIETLATALYEMVDDPGTDRYQLSMDVRHDDAQPGSAAGMFVGLRHGTTEDGVKQFGFYAFHFADQMTQVQEVDANGHPLSHSQIDWLVCEQSGWLDPEQFRSGPRYHPTLSVSNESAWRPMMLQITGDGIAASWYSGEKGKWELLRYLSGAEIEHYLKVPKAGIPEGSSVPVDFRPRAGLGIFVRNGKASFRNIRLDPLP